MPARGSTRRPPLRDENGCQNRCRTHIAFDDGAQHAAIIDEAGVLIAQRGGQTQQVATLLCHHSDDDADDSCTPSYANNAVFWLLNSLFSDPARPGSMWSRI
jgi:hypothetical protein